MLFLTGHVRDRGVARVAGAIHDLVMSTGPVPGHVADLAPGAAQDHDLVTPGRGLAVAPTPAHAAAPGPALIARVPVASLTLAASLLTRVKASLAPNPNEQVSNFRDKNVEDLHTEEVVLYGLVHQHLLKVPL